MDFLAWELRPAALDDIGIAEAMRTFLSHWWKHSGVEAQFHNTGFEKDRLSPETETNLYRIMQEALNNTIKYAQARRVDVLLERRDNQVVLIVEDDGLGFKLNQDADDRGLGLIGRASAPPSSVGLYRSNPRHEGTTIFARVPAQFMEEEEAGGAK